MKVKVLKNIANSFGHAAVSRKAGFFGRLRRRPHHIVLLDGALSIGLHQEMSQSMQRISVDGLPMDLWAIADDFRIAAFDELEHLSADG